MCPKYAVFRPSEVPIIDRGIGVQTIYLVTRGSGTMTLLNGITEFEPGATLPLHSHNCEETVLVIQGHAHFEVDGETLELDTHDTTWTPSGTPHRFANRGPGLLRVFWTYGSVEANRTLAETGETREIAAESMNSGSSGATTAGPRP
jgi:putative monooxygenase